MFKYFCKSISDISNQVYKSQLRIIPNTNFRCSHSTYEGDGKTSVNILNDQADLGLMINGVSEMGFRLNNDITVLGPMIIFPRTVLSWCVRSVKEIDENSLSLFSVLEPRLDIVIIGVGEKIEDYNLYKRLLPHMKKYRMNLEVLPTEQACSTFNFLSSEGRYVGAALIPPNKLQVTDNDLLRSKLRYQNLYELE